MTRRAGAGSPLHIGVRPARGGVDVSVFSAHAQKMAFCLFDDAGASETDRIFLPERTGDIWHGFVPDVPVGARYGLRAFGPYDPGQGHRFNPNKLLVDPCALLLDRPFVLHASMLGYEPGHAMADMSFSTTDSAAVVPKAIVVPDAADTRPRMMRTPWATTALYELHMRGFTRDRADVPAELRGTYAGLAQPQVIEHLVKLGVTTVEIMPSAAWIDERHLGPLGLQNRWGYNHTAFQAPDPRLAPGGWQEVRACVAALQAAGLEVILDIVLNHSGESDELGPTVSMRGLDNASWYRLRPDNPRYYINDAGCGNVLALDRAPIVRFAMETMRTWVRRGGFDGFRFDLAPVLGRRPDGFDAQAPLLAAMEQDPELCALKVIAEPWDIGPGGWRTGQFSAIWGEWNDRYRDDVRRFWRGDEGVLGGLATRLSGSQDLFGAKRRPSRSINYVSAHDGFTLADVVAYTHKHNGANGEDNRDGTNDNHSWNNGVEGDTDDAGIRAARLRDQRNMLATAIFSRGTPMLWMGSELGHSQGGNNNAYAQDFALDWTKADAVLTAFTAACLALRAAHPALRDDRFLTGADAGDGLPDVAWLMPDGAPMPAGAWGDGWRRTLTMVLSTPGEDAEGDGTDDRVALAFNASDSAVAIGLPPPRPGRTWRVALDTRNGDGAPEAAGGITAAPRALLLVVEE